MPAHPRLFRVVAALAAFAAALGGCEAILAIAGLPPGEQGWTAANEARVVADPRIYEPDANLLWRLRRSALIDVPDFGFPRIWTNGLGLRGQDRTRDVNAADLRVMCLGDSVTFGLGLADADAYPARLEEALRAQLPDRRPVVINAAVPGYSTVQGLRLLDELAALRPDVVVWWFGMNDGKAALGAPDSVLISRGSLDGGPLRPLRGLRSVRCAEALAARLRGDETRVSIDEERAAVSNLLARASAGGPVPVFIGCPSRLGEKLAQLEEIATSATAGGATHVQGAADALSEFFPGAASSSKLVGVEEVGTKQVAVLAPGKAGRIEITVTELVRRREFVRKWKLSVESLLTALPADSLQAEDLFGDTPPADAYADNCHLTALGCRRAAEGIAKRIVDVVRRRGAADGPK